MPSNAESICRNVGKHLKRPDLQAFIILCGKKSGSDRTSQYIDGSKHSVFAESATLSQIYDPNAQIQTILFYITEVYRLNTLVSCLRYLITLLKYTLFYFHSWVQHQQNHIAEIYPILTHIWGIPYLFTWLSNILFLIHCWAIPNPNTFFRYT